MQTYENNEAIAQALYRAEIVGEPIDPISGEYPLLLPEEAYSIQGKVIRLKLKEGARVVGKKIGLTSLAIQQALGVSEPDYGHLLDTMAVKNGGEASVDRLLQPKAEGEIAFMLKRDLRGTALTAEDVLLATDYIVPAIEIIDSRIRDWKIRLADTIADNASSGMFVLGESKTTVDGVDLPKLAMVLEKNGEKVLTGEGNAVLGNPAYAVAWLANKLSEFGIELMAGEVILSGSFSAPVSVSRGDSIAAHFTHLGSVSVRFV